MIEKRFKINTDEMGHIYLDNPNGEHMSWIEVETTLNEQHETITKLVKQLYNAQLGLIWEMSSDIDKDEKQLKETLEKQYGVDLE